MWQDDDRQAVHVNARFLLPYDMVKHLSPYSEAQCHDEAHALDSTQTGHCCKYMGAAVENTVTLDQAQT